MKQEIMSSDDKKEFVNRLKLDEDEINALEGATRDRTSIPVYSFKFSLNFSPKKKPSKFF